MKRVLLLSLSLILLLSLPFFAQDKPDPAAQAKPAAADQAAAPTVSEEERTAALAKAAQNPVADMISFPLQNNTNFGIGPYSRDQDVLNIQPHPVAPYEEVEPDHPHHPAHHLAAQRLATGPRLVWPRRLKSQPLLLSRQTQQADLGRGTGDGFSHCDRQPAGTGEGQRGSSCGRPHNSRSLGHRRFGQ